MSSFKDIQRGSRASTRQMMKQSKDDEDAKKKKIESETLQTQAQTQTQGDDEAPDVERTPTPQISARKRNTAKPAPRGTKVTQKKPKISKRNSITTTSDKKTAANLEASLSESITTSKQDVAENTNSVAPRINTKRKQVADAEEPEKGTMTAKRPRSSTVPPLYDENVAQDDLEASSQAKAAGDDAGQANNSLDFLSVPPQSPAPESIRSTSLDHVGDGTPSDSATQQEAIAATSPTEEQEDVTTTEPDGIPQDASEGLSDGGQTTTYASLIITPKKANPQLLTPPATTRARDSEEGKLSTKRPQRTRKKPDFFGSTLPTESTLDVSAEGRMEDQSHEEREESVTSEVDSEIEVARANHAATLGPKAKRIYKRRAAASTQARKTARRSNPAAAMTRRKAISKVTKPREARIIAKSPRKSTGLPTPPSDGNVANRRCRRRTSTSTETEGSIAAKATKTTSSRKGSLIVTLPLPPPDAQQLALSQALTRREPLVSKPEPQGQPEVWADSRQALCETLPYFKKPQGGCYQNDGHVYGFLFDSVGHCREYMDEDIIICRAGGSMESDGGSGMVQRKDQNLKEAQVQAVLNDIAHHNPVIVICGNRNEKTPAKMPHVYNVLGWYKPTSVWSEKTAGKGSKVWTTVKYRLERMNQHRPAWHAPKQTLDEDRSIAKVLNCKTCDHCRQEYPQVYLRSWICLNQQCDLFWTIDGSPAPLGSENMEYNPAYLLHRSQPWSAEGEQDEPEPCSVRPSLPNFGNTIGDNLTYINTRGICCPQCGRCSSRRLFSGWVCENSTCDFQLPVPHHPISPAIMHTPWDAAPTLVRNRHAPTVRITVEHKWGYKVSTYTFEGVDGRFIHAAATRPVIQEKNGADDMFRIMQSEDIGLERRTFAGKKMSGGRGDKEADKVIVLPETGSQESQAEHVPAEVMDIDEEASGGEKKPQFADGDLMTAFSMNYGMPYKFVASGASKPFDGAPAAVTEARRRLNWAARAFLQTPAEHDFNELLIFAYLQGQKVEYHDDGEEGLGPHIAALSLGGRAKMHMRMKMKHHVGCSKTGMFTEERPVPGGMAYEQRLRAWNELQPLKLCDSATYTKRRKELPREIGIFEKRMKKAEDLVTVSLCHGDIVLMDGYDVQRYLEHKVVPEDHLRFALTCRTVLENHLKPEERPRYVVEKDEMVYPGPMVSGEMGG